MELISKTEDENDLLYLYSAVIRIVFNDRIEEEEIEQLDVAEVISTFKAVAEIVDASVNEKIRNISDILNGSQQVEDQDCLESDLSDLLDYVVFQVEYDRETQAKE